MKKPSDSLRPGPLKFLAQMSIDPATIIFTVVAGLAQGIVKAILEWRDKRKAKAKAAPAPKSKTKSEDTVRTKAQKK